MKEIGEAFICLIEQNEFKNIELNEEEVKIFKNLINIFYFEVLLIKFN